VSVDGMDFPVLVRMPDGTPRETTVPVVAPVTALITHPHGGHECATRPCTLTNIEDARQLLSEDPRIVLWAELAVLAHLTGFPVPVPVPRGQFAEQLDRLDVRLRNGAIGLAVADAVATRSIPLAATHSPAVFAHHVSADLRRTLTGRNSCDTEPWQWLATPYRRSPMVRALLRAIQAGDGAVRHPDSELWEHVTGVSIPGNGCHEQLHHLAPRSAAAAQDPAVERNIIFGCAMPSMLEYALGAIRTSADWLPAVHRAMGTFVNHGRWPVAYLDPASGGWTSTPDNRSRGRP
jgi:hypothetical protein